MGFLVAVHIHSSPFTMLVVVGAIYCCRELADAVKASDLIAASGRAHPSYLHVFVKMSDVESVHIRTMMRELSLSNPTSVEPQLTSSVTSTGR